MEQEGRIIVTKAVCTVRTPRRRGITLYRIGIREKEKVNIRLEIIKKLNYYLLGKPFGLVVTVKDPQYEP